MIRNDNQNDFLENTSSFDDIRKPKEVLVS